MSKKVVLYSTKACPWCVKAKKYLEANNVDFQEHDVASDRQQLQEMINASGQTGVPVITVDDEVIIGFNQPVLEELLDL